MTTTRTNAEHVRAIQTAVADAIRARAVVGADDAGKIAWAAAQATVDTMTQEAAAKVYGSGGHTTHAAQVHAEGRCYRARCEACGWVGRKYRDEWKAKHYAARHNYTRREATR